MLLTLLDKYSVCPSSSPAGSVEAALLSVRYYYYYYVTGVASE